MKRRSFVIALASIPPLSLHSFVVSAEPVTVGAVLQIVAAIIKAADEMKKQGDFTRWRNNTTDKLKIIERNTFQIIKDIENLRIDIRSAITSNSRDEFIARLEGANLALSIAIAEVKSSTSPDANEKKMLWFASSPLVQTLAQTRYKEYGFSTMPLVLSSYRTCLAVLHATGYDRAAAELKRYLSTSYFLPAITDNVQGSFSWALIASRNESKRIRQSITDGLRPTTLGYGDGLPRARSADPHRNQPANRVSDLLQFTTTFSGSPDDPLSIDATPIEKIIIARDANYPSAHIAYMRKHDPAMIQGANRVYSFSQAENSRREWVGHYRQWAQDLTAEEINSLHLEAYVDLIKRELA